MRLGLGIGIGIGLRLGLGLGFGFGFGLGCKRVRRHIVPGHGHHSDRWREAHAPDGLGVLELMQGLRAVGRVVEVGAPRAVHLIRARVRVRARG